MVQLTETRIENGAKTVEQREIDMRQYNNITNEQSYELLLYMMPKFKKRKKVVSTYVPYTSNQELWARN